MRTALYYNKIQRKKVGFFKNHPEKSSFSYDFIKNTFLFSTFSALLNCLIHPDKNGFLLLKVEFSLFETLKKFCFHKRNP